MVRAVTLLPWVDPLGQPLERSFDTNGNIDRITLPGGAQFSYAYDGLMRLVRTIDPAGGVWTREYDAASTLTGLIDPKYRCECTYFG